MTGTEAARSLSIDRRFYHLPPRPWRKIHLDYHNSEHMPRVGDKFNPEAFGDLLQQGNVDGIVVFAKDMHGYFYYPSEYGPVHPGLSLDLLGQQVEACRKRNIRVYAYYCVTWDNYLAERHPEWLVFKRDRTTYLPKFDETPRWTALCSSNTDFVDLVLAHSRECVSRYDLDGIWYDMPLPINGECFCRNCLETLRSRGLDPFDTAVQRSHKQELLTNLMRRLYEQAHEIRPGIQVDFNNETRIGLAERVEYMDNIDIEALPTGGWGYWYFPVNVRYSRTFGKSVYGMSGRFHQSWADFGGLKHPNQLRTELASIVAQGAYCDIGDQLPPDGRLDPAVYETIGECYGEIKQIEPYLNHAAPVIEAAIIVRGLPLEDVGRPESREGGTLASSVLGLTKLLMEQHIQFDILDADRDWSHYRLIILPDALAVDMDLAEQLRAYLEKGGAIIGSHNALRLEGSDTIWADELGISYAGESPYTPAYLKLGESIGSGLPDYAYALYKGAAQWRPAASQSTQVAAQLGEPLFQRSPEHYTSHAQTPFDHVSEYAAIVRQNRIAAAAFPLGISYYYHGYWIYREVFKRLVDAVLPQRLIATTAPGSSEITLTHQEAASDHPSRWMLHIVNFSPLRRTPEHHEYLEDPIPLHNVDIGLALNGTIRRAYLASDDSPVPLERRGDRWHITLDRVETGAIVVLEEA